MKNSLLRWIHRTLSEEDLTKDTNRHYTITTDILMYIFQEFKVFFS